MKTEISKNIFWVGSVDWNLRQFHGHELSTHRGSTYNSYIIKDEKTVLIDTVWSPFSSRLIDNIKEVIDPATIDYVIAAHAEADHSGSLPEIMNLCPNARVIVSSRGMDSIPGHYHRPWNFQPVKTGDTLKLGRTTLSFIEAPMLHWPDNLLTYANHGAVLFSSDAFGQHFASSGRFNDQVDRVALYQEAEKYYANILTPFSAMVTKKIDEILALNLPLELIAPSHGLIWRDNPAQIVTAYREWAVQKPEQSAVIVFDTMWHATRLMAEAVGEGLTETGVPFEIHNAATADRNDVITSIFRAGALVLGSPTFNQGVLPTLAPVLTDIKGLKFKNKIGAAFGSYGWSGESLGLLEKHLEESGIPVAVPGVRAKWQPGTEDIESCRALGRRLGAEIKNR
ncbi:flavodoxin/nitric oxide synthase [Dehalogenimonas lykanthroporepellens BL-DC-9]|nr:flavodoxin/nitric oxide synthase [Dehalogenimonas lykanthroporepellens BL-DC-9]